MDRKVLLRLKNENKFLNVHFTEDLVLVEMDNYTILLWLKKTITKTEISLKIDVLHSV